MPFFSIITPTVNRATLLRRAIDSVLAQDFADFEVIVVDSASTDNTREMVRALAANDARIQLVTEEVRRGVCPARNIGVTTAAGDWILPLDSDDELLPGTLAMFRRHIEEDPTIDHHRYMCRWDDGSFTPRPPLIDEVWDYDGYLRFLERTDGLSGETMSCIRRSTFDVVRYPEDRAYETLYHIEFAQRFITRAHKEAARLYHSDAADQNSFVPNPRHWLRVAPDHARTLNEVVARHGAAMQRRAPRAYDALLRSASKFSFLANDRRQGLRLLLQLWSRDPIVPLSWMVFFFGMLGATPLAWADGIRFRMHMNRRRRDEERCG